MGYTDTTLSMNRSFLVVLILCLHTLVVRAQDYNPVIFLYDASTSVVIPGARVTVRDTSSLIISQGYTSKYGFFEFSTHNIVVDISIDSVPERCDGTNLNLRKRCNLVNEADTIVLRPAHGWIHCEFPPLIFKEGSTLFATNEQTTEYCDLAVQDSICPGFKSLQYFYWQYTCYPFKRLEIRSYYTSAEDDSLAQQRSQLVQNYFLSMGAKEVEFTTTPILYPTRPIKNSDGSWREEEIALIQFRILGY